MEGGNFSFPCFLPPLAFSEDLFPSFPIRNFRSNCFSSHRNDLWSPKELLFLISLWMALKIDYFIFKELYLCFYCKPFQSFFKKISQYINFKSSILNYFTFQFRRWSFPQFNYRITKHWAIGYLLSI